MKSQDAAADQEANNFYAAVVAHYGDKGAEITFSESTLPDAFLRNEEITYGGSIAVNSASVTTGTMTFSHSNSPTTYTLTGSTGAVNSGPSRPASYRGWRCRQAHSNSLAGRGTGIGHGPAVSLQIIVVRTWFWSALRGDTKTRVLMDENRRALDLLFIILSSSLTRPEIFNTTGCMP